MATMTAAHLADPRAPHSLPYMPQLDSLRAIAVLAIIYGHYVFRPYWPLGIDLVPLGTRAFLVLSGFLITAVLLRESSPPPSFEFAYGSLIAPRAQRVYLGPFLYVEATGIFGVPRRGEQDVWGFL